MIITKNKSLKVVVPANFTEREMFAAEEIAKYLKMICGGEFGICKDSEFNGGEAIAIGGPERNSLTSKYISEADFDKIVPGPEGLYIASFDDVLVLAGSSKNLNERERGTIYAVYEFLERFLDCSLSSYTKEGVPGGEYIPKKSEIELDGIFYAKAKCDVMMRGAIAQYSSHGKARTHELNFKFLDWLAKNRYNYIYTWHAVYDTFKTSGMLDACQKRGFILNVGHHDATDTMLPQRGNEYFPEHYYETHPEYYKLNEDGTRFEMVDHWGQMVLCSRNDEMIETLSNNMIEWLNKNPQVKLYSWLHKDGRAPQCCCEKCSKYTKEENNFYFLNEVAKRVGKVHPDVRIEIGVYSSLWDPPTNTDKISPNLAASEAVWHGTIRLRKTGKPDGSCLIGTIYEDNLLEWKNRFNIDVTYYDYVMGVYPGRQRLVPMADEMQAIFKRSIEKDIVGSKTQIEVFNLWNNIFNFFTFGRTGYNTDLSLVDNVNVFCRSFGKGAEFVKENILYCEEVLDGQCEIMTAGVYLMNHIDKERVYDNYEKALKAAEGDATARNNIRLMRMAFRYSDIETREEYKNDEIGYKTLKHYDIPERGELIYMRDNFDSSINCSGFGIMIPIEAEDNGFTPDIWYKFD